MCIKLLVYYTSLKKCFALLVFFFNFRKKKKVVLSVKLQQHRQTSVESSFEINKNLMSQIIFKIYIKLQIYSHNDSHIL